MPKKTLRGTTKRADRIVSEYIRKRDCLKTTGTLDYGICFTCGKRKPYDELDAGHCISRKYRSLRFHDDNIRIQCRKCNRFDGGEHAEFTVKLQRELGKKRVDKLLKKKREIKKWTIADLEDLIERTKKKIKKIEARS
jgi:hypothetical protein